MKAIDKGIAMGTVQVNRRHHERLAAHIPVRLRTVAGQRTIDTLTNDLSSGGLRCLTRGEVHREEPMIVEVSLRHGSEPLRLEARLAWLQHIAHSDQYYTGVTFTNMSPRADAEVAAFVRDMASARA